MNDEFEKHLSEIALNPPPEEWREQILARANPREPATLPWWQEWLWPCPQAWAGMAALWVIMLAMNWNGGSSARSSSTSARVMPEDALSPYSPARIAEALEAEFPFPDTETEPVAKRPSPADRPRSCRPNHIAYT
jgi:hypothetical protein